MKFTLEQMKAVVLGHAVGDALGVPAAGKSREALQKQPISEMYKGGRHRMPAGAWSDDTSMSLCALKPLAENSLDFDTIMQNFYKWYYEDKFTPTKEAFGEERTCALAIRNYYDLQLPYAHCGLKDADSNGNGSLMRIYPFVLYAATHDDLEEALLNQKNADSLCAPLKLIHAGSALTHAHPCSKMACTVYAYLLWALLKKQSKEVVAPAIRAAYQVNSTLGALEGVQLGDLTYVKADTDIRSLLDGVLDGTVQEKDIKSSSYVLHTLQIAVWALLNTDSFETCLVKAISLGGDTDTNAAVAGSLAGALYGFHAIPERWLTKLIKLSAIERLAEKAHANWSADPNHSLDFKWE